MVDAGDLPWPNSAAPALAFSPASPSYQSPNAGEGEIPAGENAVGFRASPPRLPDSDQLFRSLFLGLCMMLPVSISHS